MLQKALDWEHQYQGEIASHQSEIDSIKRTHELELSRQVATLFSSNASFNTKLQCN
jgi:hypothetical protein